MPITDNFNRADGGPGAGWTNQSGGVWEIVSNEVRPTDDFATCLLVRTESSFPNDQYAQIRLKYSSAAADKPLNQIACRVDGSGNGYQVQLDSTGLTLFRAAGGTYLTDTPVSGLTADTFYPVKIEAIGTTIKVYMDTGGGLTERISHTDATYSSGKPAIRCASGSVANMQMFDDFESTNANSEPLNPTYVAAGAAISGTGAVTPAIPSGAVANDILLLFVESANETISLTTANGFAEAMSSPQGTGTAAGTAATRLAVYWKRAVGGDASPVVADSGNHTIAQILAFRNCVRQENPWNVAAGNVAGTASTSASIPGGTTTVSDCLIVAAVANATDSATAQTSGWANGDLTDVTERVDSNTASGNGGGFGVATGVKALAGAFGATAATLATSSVQGRIAIALMPESPLPAWLAHNGSPLLRM